MSLEITNSVINFIRVNWLCVSCKESQSTRKGEVIRYFLTSFNEPKAIVKCAKCKKVNIIVLNTGNTQNDFLKICI